jgi:hypothetical protein
VAEDREEVTAAPGASGAATFELKVQRGDPPVAVPHAEVWFASGADLRAWREAHPGQRDVPHERRAGLGRRLATDADGSVWLPAPAADRTLTVVCVHDGLYGRRTVHEGEETALLLLETDHRLVVEVVDAEGRPQPGVPVDLFRVQQSWSHSIWSGTTSAPDGTVTIEHAQARFRNTWDSGFLCATLGFPCKEERLETVPTEEPEARVRLTLPATGTLTVTVRGLDGELLEDDASVDFQEHRPGVSFFSNDRPLSFRADAEDGRLALTHVDLGLELELTASCSEPWKPAKWQGPGPLRAGQDVSVELRFEEMWPTLLGRLVDDEGAPLAGTKAEVETEVQTERTWSSHYDDIETDDEGRFELILRNELTESSEVTLTFDVELSEERGGPVVSVTEVPGPFRAGPNEIGDVVIGTANSLATGVVVGPAGEPIAGAEVDCYEWSQWGEAPDQGTWQHLWNQDVRTNERGEFAVQGVIDGDRMQLSASHADYTVSERVEVAVGSTGVQLALGAAGSLRATVEVADGVPARLVEAVLEHADPELGMALTSRFTEEGTVDMGRLKPGTYTLSVRLVGEPEPLHSVTGVVVRANERTTGSHLTFDLRDDVGAVRLDVRDTAGAPIRSGHVRVLPRDAAEPPRRGMSIVQGAATVIFTGESVDLELVSEGYRSLRLERVRSDREAVLREGIPVVLRIPSGLELPTGSTHLLAYLEPVDDTPDVASVFEVYGADGERDWLASMPAVWTGDSKEFSEDDREVRQSLRLAGTYRVRWQLMARTENMATTWSVDGGGEEGSARDRVDVLDLDVEQVFDVEPDAKGYAAALERADD